MLVKKIKNEYGCNDIILENDNKQLRMFFLGNLDLYWSIYDYDQKDDSNIREFMITKENYRIYELFDELYKRVKNCEISKINEVDLQFCRTMEDLKECLEKIKRYNQHVLMIEENNSERLFKDNMIQWHCDDASYEDAHVLKIMPKDEDSYLVRIELNNKELYNRNSIRFRNARSGHNPFNVLFMEMFNKLQDYNINDKQIHMEEYVYHKKMNKQIK